MHRSLQKYAVKTGLTGTLKTQLESPELSQQELYIPANSTSPQRMGLRGLVLGPCISGRSWGNSR